MKVIYSWEDWKIFAEIAIRSVFVGIFRPIWLVVTGIVSFLYYLYTLVKNFTKREFVASLVIGAILTLLSFGWLATFVSERKHRVDAEMQRDKLRYELDSTKQLIPNRWNNDTK